MDDGTSDPDPARRFVVRLDAVGFGGRLLELVAWAATAPDDAAVVFVDDSVERSAANVDTDASGIGRGTVGARRTPVTDAIKRVDADLVLDTVDRSLLDTVDAPIVVPIALLREWLAARRPEAPAGDEARRPFDVAALLSEFVSIEPDLRVVDLGPVLQPGASHG